MLCPGDPGAHARDVPEERILPDLEAADGLHEQAFPAAEVGDDESVIYVRLSLYCPRGGPGVAPPY
jgi:hypothetical protein